MCVRLLFCLSVLCKSFFSQLRIMSSEYLFPRILLCIIILLVVLCLLSQSMYSMEYSISVGVRNSDVSVMVTCKYNTSPVDLQVSNKPNKFLPNMYMCLRIIKRKTCPVLNSIFEEGSKRGEK